MSVSEQYSDIAGAVPAGTAVSSGSPVAGARDGRHQKRVLLVWDAPNLDMGLGAILGGRPTAAYRPRFDALGRWLLSRTAELSASGTDTLEPEATVFTNIAAGSADVVRPWVEALRNVGFAVFAKPKIDEDSDVDSDMLDHIALRHGEGLAGVMVASATVKRFANRWRTSPRPAFRSRYSGSASTPAGRSRPTFWTSSISRTSPACSGSHSLGSASTHCPTRVPGCSRSDRFPPCSSGGRVLPSRS